MKTDRMSEYDKFLNNCKTRGTLIYRCYHCDFRGMGAAVFYHEFHNQTHVVYVETDTGLNCIITLSKS